MNAAIRRTLMIAIVLLTVIAAGVAARHWLRDTIRAANEADELQQTLRDEDERSAELMAEVAATLTRITTKIALVDALAAGRLSLRDATERFRELHDSCPRYTSVLRAIYPDLSADERVSRNVIEFCSTTLEGRPERTEVLARLENEYAALQQRR